MAQLFSYMLTSAIFMLPLYLVFRLLMAGERQPGFNRLALYMVYVISLLTPALCRVDLSGAFAPAAPSPEAEVVIGMPLGAYIADVEHVVSPVWRWLIIAYGAGVVVASLLTLLSVAALWRLVRQAEEVHHAEAFTIYVLPDACGIAPFSFKNCIVLGRRDFDTADVSRLIILHESCHVRHRHWIDLLMAQTVCILQWFNPVTWLMRDEMRSVHEYQADADVLDALHGNISLYQNLLIKKAVGARFPSLANSLNHSNLKKRITMMYKSKPSSARRLVGAFAVVPAVVGAVMLVNVPAVSAAISSIKSTSFETVSEITQNPADVQLLEATAAENASEMLSEAMAYKATMTPAAESRAIPDEPRLADVKVIGYASETKTANKSNIVVEEKVDKVAEFPGGLQALFKWMGENVRYPESAAKADVQGRVLVNFIIDKEGNVMEPEIARAVSPDLDEEAIRVVKSMPRWTPAELNGANVAMMYTLPIEFKLTQASDKKQAAPEGNDGKIKINGKPLAESPTVKINGHLVDATVLKSINPHDIKLISVLKEDPAYPNGLIEVELKDKK